MPRALVKRNDYEAVGEWLLDYWDAFTEWDLNKIGPAPQPDINALKALIDDAPANMPVHQDDQDTMHVVIPRCPWTNQDVKAMKAKDKGGNGSNNKYKFDLGFFLCGGCR